MKVKLTALMVLCLMVLCMMVACKKNDNPAPDIEKPYTPGPTISVAVQGRITDNNNKPVSGAIVSAGGVTATTDVNGGFSITNAQLPQQAGVVKVNKSGFFTGYRTLQANATGSTYFAQIQLIPKTTAGSFTAAAGGTVVVPNGGSIRFESNSVATAIGTPYTGTVKVAAFFMNPADSAFNSYMPGDLRGINSNGNERLLQSFGMVVAELEGSNGEKLQLATGQQATITLPIAAHLQGTAPASIPLWHFDEAAGLWKEEGSGSRQGNNFVGTVKHFSTWNFDLPYSLCSFEAMYKDQNGQPWAHTFVQFKRPNGDIRMGFTDINGQLRMQVPAAEALTMQVINLCGDVLYTQNVGPYAVGSSNNGGTITVNRTAANVTITGTATTCSGAPLANGLVEVVLEGRIHRSNVVNGAFSVAIQRCSGAPAQAYVTVYDTVANQQNTPVAVNVTTGTANAGTLSACGVDGLYIYLTVDGQQYSWTRPNDPIGSNRYQEPYPSNQFYTTIDASKVLPNFNAQQLQLKFPGPTSPVPGTYNLILFQFYPNGHTGTNVIYYSINNVIPVQVTEYGLPGGILKGSFSAMVRKTGGTLVQMYCSFRLIRGGV
jgi:hypothetical protein